MMSASIYYLNGEFVRAEDASLPLGDLAIVRGFGVFDFLRTYNGVPFMLRAHVERLLNSAQQIGLSVPLGLDEIESIVLETNARNECADATIRIVATGGISSNFFTPEDRTSIAVMVEPIRPYPPETYLDGAAVTTTDIPRYLPTVKSLSYLGAIMAMQHASKEGAVEAVYRTAEGKITEGTRSNLFLVKDGTLVTPAKDILIGITRQAVIEAVRGQYDVVESEVRYEEMLAADELFLTSTTKEVMPVSRVDGAVIGTGRAGECTLDIAEKFQRFVQRTVRESPA